MNSRTSWPRSRATDCLSTEFDIVIVGGGAAGVGAARRLAGSGRSTLLLEASPRIGGRAWTQRIRGFDLDLGCGWLHSADRNGWVDIARGANQTIDQRKPVWGQQFHDLGFTPTEQQEARGTLDRWVHRLSTNPPPGDCAADALEAGNRWNAYVRAIVGFISGGPLERLSSADYVAYDETSTDENWRVREGYGSLIASALPDSVRVRLATPVQSLSLTPGGVELTTPAGSLRARAVILTVSTQVLAGESIRLPTELGPWRDAASSLPMGRNEKLFLEIIESGPFEEETQVFGNPHDARTGAYYIRPMGMPVIECFFGGESAEHIEHDGPAAGFEFALDQITALFGSEVRRMLKPLIASNWGRMDQIGGAYSYALPGRIAARATLAKPFGQRVFFAGEATSQGDFSTAHGALDSGVRAAEQAMAALAV
nr:hypothetical protein [uncultured bacterium]